MAALVLRVVHDSRSELREGERLRKAGHVETAVAHYRRAARAYVPGNPFDEAALEALARMADEAEGRGDTQLALRAYRSIRAGILATRSFYTPHAARLRAANARIADLTASLPPPPMDADKTRQQLRKEHLELLQHFDGPRVAWALVSLAGFVMWVGGAFGFSVRGFDERNGLIRRPACRWGTLVVVGLGLFVLGLALA